MKLIGYLKCWMFAVVILLYSSCSTDYTNVIPGNSIALVSMDFCQLLEKGDQGDQKTYIRSLLGTDDWESCGVDFTQKAYIFEAADGATGMVAAVKSKDDLNSWMKILSQKGLCTPLVQRKGYDFCVLHDNFVMGFSDNAILIMGPTVAAAQGELRRRMCRYLKADDKDLSSTDLFQKLSSLEGPVNLVARVDALPDKLAGLAALGVPDNAKKENTYISATMAKQHECLIISSETFSFDADTEKAIQSSQDSFKPVTDKYLKTVDGKSLFTFACNVKGENYVSMLHDNESFKVMLAGLNTLVDMDMMLKSVDGDFLLNIPSLSDSRMDIRMLADAKDAKWLADVDYWKKSCPKGCTIKNGSQIATFRLTGKKWNTCFGVLSSEALPYKDKVHQTEGILFFSEPEASLSTLTRPATSGYDPSLLDQIKDSRICAIINLQAHRDDNEMTSLAASVLRPFFGNFRTIVYRSR